MVGVHRAAAGLARRARRADRARRCWPRAAPTRRPRARRGRRVGGFARRVEDDARRRIAEEKGPDHVANVAVRPTIDRLDFTAARRADLEEMRREIYPLARRLATRLTHEHHARRRGPLDFRRTVRASISTGGVPLTTHHRPKRPHRTELVVLCDVSGSVANFAQFTLLLVFALRDQFQKVRAFTFVDHVHEVTDALHARRRRRRRDGRPRRQHRPRGAVGPHQLRAGVHDGSPSSTPTRSARSPRCWCSATPAPTTATSPAGALRDLAGAARHAWWLNPEHTRHWDTGDSAAPSYAEIVPMVECRNLTQLGEFVHDIL